MDHYCVCGLWKLGNEIRNGEQIGLQTGFEHNLGGH